MDCSPPGSSVHGIPQARILEWVAVSFSRVGSFLPGVWLLSPASAGVFFTTSTTWDVQRSWECFHPGGSHASTRRNQVGLRVVILERAMPRWTRAHLLTCLAIPHSCSHMFVENKGVNVRLWYPCVSQHEPWFLLSKVCSWALRFHHRRTAKCWVMQTGRLLCKEWK